MPSKKRLKIVVGINSLVSTNYEAYTNHIQMWYNLGRLKVYRHIDFILVNPARMSIDRMRNLTAKTALEMNADYLLFWDDDVLLQMDALDRLLKCRSDIACGPVPIRGYPFDWMVFKRKGPNLFACSKIPDSGIYPCDAVGFSWCLIKVDLLRKIPINNGEPYFVTGLNNTEDIYFCVRARQAVPSCTIVCDCSIMCGHILWPEVMDSRNRKSYSKYYEKINPHVKILEAINKRKRRNKRGDRGKGYLADVKEVLSGKVKQIA